ncbi:MAG: hypothetical protein BroJett025_07670 [Patescibacteria group bacterium]|nr:MAG: hypothetical protein BroJett025_07670 [Patescibacteria group bacterium]
MYNQRNSRGGFNHSQGNYRSFNSQQNRGGGGRKKISFDPSMIVQQHAVAEPEKPKYQAKHTFADFPICEQLKKNILAKGYSVPTPIQDQAIPHILDTRDIIGLASTGTGKTAAFLIPLINNIYQNSGRVLIMAPTRELAVQIRAEFTDFVQGMDLYSALCIGGVPLDRQIATVKRRPHFIIGTPGRLIDLEKRGVLNFKDFSAIVLDEVDRMFDMGFIENMKYVIARLPEQRHSLFFSATLPNKLTDIVRSFLRHPITVEIEKQTTSANVKQEVIKVNGKSKVDILHELLKTEGFTKVLVFGRTKHGLNKLSTALDKRGFKVGAIHGNKSQNHRQKILQQFKDDRLQVLLATDIASRGLDIDNVTHVINYDLPQTYEDYIHRIGRTGRANKTGAAFSFVD